MDGIVKDEARFTFGGGRRVSDGLADILDGEYDDLGAKFVELGIGYSMSLVGVPTFANAEAIIRGEQPYPTKITVTKDATTGNTTVPTWINAMMARAPHAQFSVPIHSSGHVFPTLMREYQLEFLRSLYDPSIAKEQSPFEIQIAKNPGTVEEARLQNEGANALMPAIMKQLMSSEQYTSLPYTNVLPDGLSRSLMLRRSVLLARQFGLIGWVDTEAAEMAAWMALNGQTIPTNVTVEELRDMNVGQWPTLLPTLRQEAIEMFDQFGRKWDAIGVSLSGRLSKQKQSRRTGSDAEIKELQEQKMDSIPLPSRMDGAFDDR
jgi:hypothetical protein